MPSILEVAGEALGGTILAPILIGGAVVTAIASPDVRMKVRRLGVRGMAAALAAGDAARRELRFDDSGTRGLAVQIGQRLKEAITEVREDWDDFVAEARAERQRLRGGRAAGARNGASNGERSAASRPTRTGAARRETPARRKTRS